MASRLGISQRSVGRVIREDLGKVLRKKLKVHRLKPTHIANRKRNCRRLYEQHIAGDRSEFSVTLDEALFYLQDIGGERRICYVRPGEDTSDRMVWQKQESLVRRLRWFGK